jgi:hypothetical protein
MAGVKSARRAAHCSSESNAGHSDCPQAVFHFRRDLMMDEASDDPVGFHLPKLLYQHLLRDRRDGALKFGEPLGLPPNR